jgi:hypothetical protein
MHSCIDGIAVSSAILRATIWSNDVPTNTSDPCVCFGCDCVRNTALDLKWSPPISGASNASAMRTSVLLTIVRYSRQGSSGASAPSGLSWKLRPISAGAHRCFDAPQVFDPAHPCTSSMHTSRVFSVAADAPPNFRSERTAGSIASR